MLYKKAHVRIVERHVWVNNYQLLGTLGQGAFGEVVVAAMHSDDSDMTMNVAIKCYSKSYLMRQREVHRTLKGNHHITALDRVYAEIFILENIKSHRNVISIIEVLDEHDGDDLYVVLALADAGVSMTHSIQDIRDLGPWAQQFLGDKTDSEEETPVFEYINDDLSPFSAASGKKSNYYKLTAPSTNTPYSIEQCAAFLYDLAHGIQHIHRGNVAHRDIKPENLLLTATGHLLIADFGAAIHFLPPDTTGANSPASTPEHSTPGAESYLNLQSLGLLASPSDPDLPLDWVTDTAGSYLFLSPEAASGDGYSAFEADIWAIGVTFYCFLFGILPFGTFLESPLELFDEIQHAPLKPHPFHCAVDPERTKNDADLLDLLERFLSRDRNSRILTVGDILNHAFMARYRIVDHAEGPVEDFTVNPKSEPADHGKTSAPEPMTSKADQLSEGVTVGDEVPGDDDNSAVVSEATDTAEIADAMSPTSTVSLTSDPVTNTEDHDQDNTQEKCPQSPRPHEETLRTPTILARPRYQAINIDKLPAYSTPELSLHLYQLDANERSQENVNAS